MVSSNGEAGEMIFTSSTIRHDSSEFTRGYSYTLEEDVLSLEIEDATEPAELVFQVEREGQDYHLVPETEQTRDELGSLVLSPTQED
ncbi:hypothetical protein [Nesterenkonia sphaerica]|uniref:Uncharacterized protein n=1 Tax=Nesterenkonia sphaerica TaxID=1804988 RepID=A0A5R9A6V8_9MICC|nr:hypothetical protein [Nesterenkonia sphaerica]TLP74421.1 hypothetical protein FEF27_08695 [Nesterenkonia sphaerica]